jgi:hypothetical protein
MELGSVKHHIFTRQTNLLIAMKVKKSILTAMLLAATATVVVTQTTGCKSMKSNSERPNKDPQNCPACGMG